MGLKDRIMKVLTTELEGVKAAKEDVDARLQDRINRTYKKFQDGEVSETELNATIAAASAISAGADLTLPETVGEATLMAAPAVGKLATKGAKAAKALKASKMRKMRRAVDRKASDVSAKEATKLHDEDIYEHMTDDEKMVGKVLRGPAR